MAELINLTGMRFTRWNVLSRDYSDRVGTYWLCRCDCGREVSVNSINLTRGVSRSCGCLRAEMSREKFRSAVDGKRFGRLTVAEVTGGTGGGTLRCRCVCDCGEEAVVTSKQLLSGKTQSCGCLRLDRVRDALSVELTGSRHGRLTVLERALDRDTVGVRYWRCVCDCGAEKVVPTSAITKGYTRSCGCLARERITTHGMTGTLEYGRFMTAKRRARLRERTPKWANLERIRDVYTKCPKGYHVDHIVPLYGELVCGLHVEWNLQYLTPFENCSKNRKYVAGVEGRQLQLPNMYLT